MRSPKGSLADKLVQMQKQKRTRIYSRSCYYRRQKLDNVFTFQYLGCGVKSDGDERADVDHRMAIAQILFNLLSHILSDH